MPARELPPNFKHIMEFEFYRKLNFKEALKAMFGYGLLLKCKVKLEHRPGRFEPSMLLTTTKETEITVATEEMLK